jgi:ArpU family phage transcriptional regulator
MSQLAFLNTNLNKEVKRRAEKIMSKYRNLEAIIESKQLKTNKMTINYEASESQRGNGFHSQTEDLALERLEIQDYLLAKKKLDILYKSLKPIQQEIWEKRYILGQYDTQVYLDLGLPHRSYYRLKREMIAVIADGMGYMNN